MIANKKAIIDLAKQDKRLDGRAFTDYRENISIETGVSRTAEGSARVQIGDTKVIVGVKISAEKPYNDTPDQGGIMVNVELTSLSSPEYERGPPGIKAIELSRVIDRGIREAKAIDMKKLCITPGEKAWFVLIDAVTINDAGGLFDAIGMGVIAALKDARLPEFDTQTGTVNYKKRTDTALPLTKEPLSVTVYKVGEKLLVDPTRQEEEAYDARLTVASDSNGVISAMQKGGSAPLTVEEVGQIVDIALEKANFLRERL